MAEFRYDALPEVLLEQLPELQQEYDDQRHFVEGLPHIVFEDVLMPHLLDALKNSADNADFLLRAFSLLEQMITHRDESVENVGAVSVIEPLIFNGGPRLLAEAKRLMGPASLKATIAMENWNKPLFDDSPGHDIGAIGS